ncbi:MAG: DUF4338 domain-containing protein [Clostridia bacterium]|nr:MAG: DUF4338 domain-containing protein [Clostridia bacterium]
MLEEMDADGIIKIPAKRVLSPYRPARLHAQPLPSQEIVASLRELQPVTVEAVAPEEQALWDATVDRYHALGFRRAFGAHQRYWIRGELGGCRVTLGALLFAAAARNVAVRDAWLGWTSLQQQRYRHLFVANSRFLILPGVRVPHLASHALALALRGLRSDWQRRFGYAPVVVETFVEPPWRGTCYRAAKTRSSDGCWRGPRPSLTASADRNGLPLCSACHKAPLAVVCKNCGSPKPWSPIASAGQAVAENLPLPLIRNCGPTSNAWSRPRHAATPSLRCAGLSRVHASWPRS